MTLVAKHCSVIGLNTHIDNQKIIILLSKSKSEFGLTLIAYFRGGELQTRRFGRSGFCEVTLLKNYLDSKFMSFIKRNLTQVQFLFILFHFVPLTIRPIQSNNQQVFFGIYCIRESVRLHNVYIQVQCCRFLRQKDYKRFQSIFQPKQQFNALRRL